MVHTHKKKANIRHLIEKKKHFERHFFLSDTINNYILFVITMIFNDFVYHNCEILLLKYTKQHILFVITVIIITELFFRLEVNKLKARSSFFWFKFKILLYKSVGLDKRSSLILGSK
jgi:hypothetical protein